MHELTGKMIHAATNYATGKPVVTLELNEKQSALNMVDTLREYDMLTVKIDRYKAKRSLNANNYAWKLITEIANVTRSSKEEVYLRMLKDYGQSDLVSVLAHIPVEHYFKYYEEAGESTLNGKLFKHYRVYKGSSEFDTREMSIFIDGIVSEAKNLGIETMTPNEIAKMKDLWG
jgi:hypothetical protein